jgi:glycosyltransferase involved in cell wall biosynthesis
VSHILLLGVGPLPFYESDQLYGFGIRAWQFAQPLLDDGHKITLVTCEFGVHRESSINVKYRSNPAKWANLEHIPLPQPNERNTNILLTRIEDILKTHKPDAIVAAGSTITTNLAALLETNIPIWMDMFGDLFAEVQAKTPFVQANDEIEFFHQTLTRVLLRGDRFSSVSEIQRGAAIGQLGLMGRLNGYTLGEELVWTIPCAMNGKVTPIEREPLLRHKVVAPNDFLILCSGGFNTWTDVDTLFECIEMAMGKDRSIHCVVTGGEITGHHEDGFTRFKSLISKSPYESRFHLLGWLQNQDVDQVTLECDLGINIDLPIYESVLGSRNRMLFWLQCGLPIVTTVTTEISRILVESDYAMGTDPGNTKGLAKLIVKASQDREALQDRAIKAKRFAYEYLTFEETVQPLLYWARNPAKAKDNQERIERKGQALNKVDALWHAWGFPDRKYYQDPTVPKPYNIVIHTRPQGKSWWRRLLGM